MVFFVAVIFEKKKQMNAFIFILGFLEHIATFIYDIRQLLILRDHLGTSPGYGGYSKVIYQWKFPIPKARSGKSNNFCWSLGVIKCSLAKESSHFGGVFREKPIIEDICQF